MSLGSGDRLGRYEIVSLLGAGGMGVVYRARDTKLGREVAIKVLPEELARDPERMARFAREARALAALNHPSVATLHGLEEHEGSPFLVMELVEGETLSERIARGPMSVEETLPLFESIARGLEAAHEKGIVHRDLKPGNVKVTPEGNVKILDFGLAKLAEVEPGPDEEVVSRSPTLTRGTVLGTILGTASYMSPEQARGGALDRRTDIWAFGCCLYEALTGRKAFDGDTITDVLASILKNEPDWSRLPADTPSSLRRLLRRCLEKDPRERLRDIGDARFEIRESAHRSPPPGTRLPRSPVIPVVAAALTGGLLSGVLTWALLGRSAPAPSVGGRFEIGLPPGEHLVGHFTNPLALSPDGTKLVFASAAGDRPPELYLRDLQSFESRRLPRTTGATGPFFSPDGSWVGFFAEGKLKKLPVDGGTTTDICSVSGLQLGGSWIREDTILFADAMGNGLYRVGASGGIAEKLTEPDIAEGENRHAWPQILPDGQSVLFNIETEDGLFDAVLSLETGRWSRIPRGDGPSAISRYSPSGHLLTPVSGGLIAVPFGGGGLQPAGARVSLPEEVYTSVTGSGWFALSSTGTLVYVAGTRDLNQLVWVDRQGRPTPAVGDRGDFWNPRISPDGERVAVSIQSGIRSDIWIYDLDREAKIRFTSTGRNNLFPVWSPDGRRIAFAANRSGAFRLYWAASDGSGDTELVTAEERPLAVSSWSPDGRDLLFHSVPEMDLLAMRVDGDRSLTPIRATRFREMSGTFSPDGRFLAYASDESGRLEIYVQPYPGPGERIPISSGGGRAPLWSRDGREIFFRNGTEVMAAPVETDPVFRAGRPRELFEGRYAVEPGMQHDYDVSPDGERFLMIAMDDEAVPAEIRVVLNWFEEVERLSPAH